MRWPKKLLFGTIVTLVVLSVPELILRLVLFEVAIAPPASVCAWHRIDPTIDRGDSVFEADPDCFYDLRAGARYSYLGTPMETIEHAGFRGPVDHFDDANGLRIACLGDSSTFGMCVSESMTWCRQLEGVLREELPGRPIAVFNGGVMGYTVYQGLKKYEKKVRPLRPNVTVIAFGAVNEKFPNAGLSDYERAATWKSDYFDHRAQWSSAVWRLRTAQWLFQGRLAQQRERWMETVRQENRELAAFTSGEPYHPRMSDDEFLACLEELIDAVARDGGRPILINPHRRPSTEKQYPQLTRLSEIILDVAKQRKLTLFNANALFKKNPNLEAEYFSDFWHPNVRGNRVLADGLAKIICDQVCEQEAPNSQESGADEHGGAQTH